MARTKQRLINYHTTGTTVPSTGDVQGGEIVVRNNEQKPELLIRAGAGFAVFEASGAVKTRIDEAIQTAKTTLEGEINALTAATATLETSISNVSGAVESKYALKTEVEAVDDKLSGYATTATADELDDRLTTAEGKISTLTTATGTLNTAISNVSGAVKTNYATKTVAQGYANAASAEAKTYVDTQLTGYAKTIVTDALDGRIDALEGLSGDSHTHGNKGVLDGIDAADVALWTKGGNSAHNHTNKTELDKIATGDVTRWNNAAAAQHSHDNKTVLDTITTAKTAAWDSALEDAKEYTDTEIDKLSGNTADAIEGLEETINTKISAAYVYKGSVANYSGLPESGKTVGFVYNVVNANGDIPAGTNYAWNGTAWDALGGSVDLSGYATTAVTNGLRSDLTTAQGKINSLTAATGTLSTAISNVSGAVKSNYALKTEVEAVDDKLAGYATTAVTDGLGNRLTAAEEGIEALTAATGTVSSNLTALSASVESNYATKTVAQGYANAASAEAKTYVDTQLTGYAETSVTNALDTRIDALEALSGDSHTHGNKGVLDGIDAADVTLWTKGGNSAHNHTNKAELDKIDSGDVAKWDGAVTKANTAVQSVKVTGVTGVDVTGTTAVMIDMTDLVIDCGEF